MRGKEAMVCCWREGKGPQPVVMVAGATHLPNHVSEPETTRGSAACLWSRREPRGAKGSTTNFCTTMGLDERPHNGRCFE